MGVCKSVGSFGVVLRQHGVRVLACAGGGFAQE